MSVENLFLSKSMHLTKKDVKFIAESGTVGIFAQKSDISRRCFTIVVSTCDKRGRNADKRVRNADKRVRNPDKNRDLVLAGAHQCQLRRTRMDAKARPGRGNGRQVARGNADSSVVR